MRQDPPTCSPRFSLRQNTGAVRVLVAALLTACAAIPLVAQSPKPGEYEVKAAYLLNFGKFVRHAPPEPTRSSFDICLLGHDDMGRTINDLASNESIDGLPIHVRRVPDVTDAKTCAILFISASEGDRLREDLAILAGSDILTVGDAPDFLDRGGMVQFVLISSHLRFAINLNAANRAHLVFSSELLRVASSVTGKPQTGDLP